MDKAIWIMVYIVVPLVLAYAVIMSFVMGDLLYLLISLVGTMGIMFQIGYGVGKDGGFK